MAYRVVYELHLRRFDEPPWGACFAVDDQLVGTFTYQADAQMKGDQLLMDLGNTHVQYADLGDRFFGVATETYHDYVIKEMRA